jgi:hypothetical protein
LLEGVALQLGFSVWYWRDLDFNSRDWDLTWSGSSWREKAKLDALRFDQNLLTTNALAHAWAGVGNYHIARGNGFSAGTSVAVAFVTSVLWEYFVEFREYPSLNDIVTNTVASFSLGEPLYRIGEFLLRSPGVLSRATATLISPVASVNDWVDGRVRPPEPTDSLGFTLAGAHRFRLRGGMTSRTFDRQQTRRQMLLGGDAELVMLPGYGRMGNISRWTRTSDWVLLQARAGFDGGLSEFAFRTRTSWMGYYAQSIAARPDGAPSGHGLFVGLASAYEYEGLERPIDPDHLASLMILGPLVELTMRESALRLRWQAEAYPAFGMIDALAFKGRLPPLDKEGIYRPGEHGGRIPGVVGARGYSFSLGVAAATRLELFYRAFEAGAEANLDHFTAIRGRDRFREEVRNEYHITDERAVTRLWLGVHPFGPTLGIAASLGWRWRRGYADELQARTFDQRMDLGLTLVF